MSSEKHSPGAASGALSATTAFLLWGIFPIYWKQMEEVPALELIAHRIVWLLVILLLVLGWRGNFRRLQPAFAGARVLGRNALSSAFLAVNWTVFVWAMIHGLVIESSLGYFLVPLVNVALGSMLLHERLRTPQWIAIGLAAAGVAFLLLRVGQVPWVALVLAGTWAAYGLMKKKSSLGPIAGLTAEALLLAPFALGLILWWHHTGVGAFGRVDARTHAFMIGSGLVTAIPLLLFAHGAQRIRLATLGLLQYVAPTVQFLIGLLVYHEKLDAAQLQAFALIWIGLALYSADGIWAQRRLLLKSVGAG